MTMVMHPYWFGGYPPHHYFYDPWYVPYYCVTPMFPSHVPFMWTTPMPGPWNRQPNRFRRPNRGNDNSGLDERRTDRRQRRGESWPLQTSVPFDISDPWPTLDASNNKNNMNNNKTTTFPSCTFEKLRLDYELTQDSAQHPTVFDGESPGIDFYCPNNGVGYVLQSLEQVQINTHVVVRLPPGYVGLLVDKSSVVTRHQLKVEAGLIDNGYRGEIRVCLRNVSSRPVEIVPGQAVAQMLLLKAHHVDLHKVDRIGADTWRGLRGFGGQEQRIERSTDDPKTHNPSYAAAVAASPHKKDEKSDTWGFKLSPLKKPGSMEHKMEQCTETRSEKEMKNPFFKTW